jgi:hypothetical protein
LNTVVIGPEEIRNRIYQTIGKIQHYDICNKFITHNFHNGTRNLKNKDFDEINAVLICIDESTPENINIIQEGMFILS